MKRFNSIVFPYALCIGISIMALVVGFLMGVSLTYNIMK